MKKLAAIVLVLWSTLVCAAFAPFYVPVINIVSTNNPCASLDSSTTALVARMTVDPGCPRKLVINDLIVSLKTAGVWAKLDVLYLFAAADSQSALLNWVSSNYDGTAVNSPIFTTDRGFVNSGTNGYVDTNFNPTTASSPNYTQNNAHISLWNRDEGQNDSGDAGYVGSSNNIFLRTRNSSNNATFSVNTSGSVTAVNTNSIGHFLANRSGVSAQQGYIRGVLANSNTTATASLVNTNISFIRRNSSYGGKQLAMGSIGGSLTGTEVSDFSTAIQTYMTAIGAYP